MSNPIGIALIATIVTVIAYSLAGKISNRFFRGLAQLASVVVTLALAGMISGSPEVAARVGEYYFIGIVACVILGKLFGGSGKGT